MLLLPLATTHGVSGWARDFSVLTAAPLPVSKDALWWLASTRVLARLIPVNEIHVFDTAAAATVGELCGVVEKLLMRSRVIKRRLIGLGLGLIKDVTD